MPRDPVPPYLHLAAGLRRQIEQGEILPGEQIPSLDRLASEHSVSRATVQKAIRVLIDEGLIETRPRWGAFVTERKPPGSQRNP